MTELNRQIFSQTKISADLLAQKRTSNHRLEGQNRIESPKNEGQKWAEMSLDSKH